MENIENINKIINILGLEGRMISGSKSEYIKRNPYNLFIFNSNICTKEDGKIWFGDIDVTKDAEKLIKLSFELNKIIYILYEMDGRFEQENNPRIEKYVIRFEPDGKIYLSQRMEKYFIVIDNEILLIDNENLLKLKDKVIDKLTGLIGIVEKKLTKNEKTVYILNFGPYIVYSQENGCLLDTDETHKRFKRFFLYKINK